MRVQIVVRLTVKDFESFESFERQAVAIMAKHGGWVLAAFETKREGNGTGEEIHVLEFPNEQAFAAYRSDPALQALKELREQGIAATAVDVSLRVKSYGA